MVLITHGHEDHIGGILPWSKPMSLSTLDLGKIALIRGKLEDNTVMPNSTKSTKHWASTCTLEATFFRTTHTRFQNLGNRDLAPRWKIVCTGDFKAYYTCWWTSWTPSHGSPLEQASVLCLLSDSTTSGIPNLYQLWKVPVNPSWKIIEWTHGRIIFASFASNILRLNKQLRPLLRPVVRSSSLGRLMEKPSSMNRALAIKVPAGTIIEPNEIKDYAATMKSWSCVQEAKESHWQPSLGLQRNAPPSAPNQRDSDLLLVHPGNTTSKINWSIRFLKRV